MAAGLSLAALLVLALLALLPDLGGCRDEGNRDYALLRKTVLPYFDRDVLGRVSRSASECAELLSDNPQLLVEFTVPVDETLRDLPSPPWTHPGPGEPTEDEDGEPAPLAELVEDGVRIGVYAEGPHSVSVLILYDGTGW